MWDITQIVENNIRWGRDLPIAVDLLEATVDSSLIHWLARLTTENNKMEEKWFLSFGKSVPNKGQFCLELPLTFYFYFLNGEN